MACYVALASVMDLLKEIRHPSGYTNFLVGRSEIFNSLHEKFSLLFESLEEPPYQWFEGYKEIDHGYKEIDPLERRIRDVAFQVEDVLEFEILKQQMGSRSGSGEYDQNLQNAEGEVDSILEELMQARGDSELNQLPASIVKFASVSGKVGSIVRHGSVAYGEPDYLFKIRDSGWVQSSSSGEYVQNLKNAEGGFDSILEALKQARGDSELNQVPPSIGEATDVEFKKRDDLFEIRDRLCGQSSSSGFQVIQIVGTGGIGKTTFARNIFDDAAIVNHFDCRVWVTVHLDYHVYSVLESILESLGIMATNELHRGDDDEGLKKRGKKKEDLGEHMRKKKRALEDQIHKHLKGRKYLIVIDNVWGEKVWDDMKRIFPNDSNGSRLLLITRSLDVARYAGGSGSIYEMRCLGLSESWKLLKEKLFAQNRCPPELKDIGRLIASKCGGLPLAISVTAGILSNRLTLKYWTMFYRDLGDISTKDHQHLNDLLSISFNQLSHHLKACFLYIGSFPEDYEINIARLSKLWVAEGFLRSFGRWETLEQAGKRHIKDLVKKNLVLVTKKGVNGQFKRCTMHGVLRDFCRHKAIYECFFHDKDRVGVGRFYPNEAKKVRRIILNSFAPFEPWAYNDGKYVRSFCWFSKMTIPDVPNLECVSNITFSNVHTLEWGSLKLLKILDAADIETLVAPFAISRMFRLKYLALRLAGKKKKQLPRSIFKFKNLQTLIISSPGCESISLPNEVWNMSDLRHLIIDKMVLPCVPATVGDIPLQQLEHLQTLQTVEDFIFTDDATRMIPNIRKLKLSCKGVEAGGIWKLHCLNNLVHLQQLKELKITFDTLYFSYLNSLIWRSFVLPRNLKKLSLKGCGLPWEASTVLGSLWNLQVLRLRKNAMVGAKWEPIEGNFLRLRFLLLDGLDLTYWRADKLLHFPHLEHLKINQCPKFLHRLMRFKIISTLQFSYDTALFLGRFVFAHSLKRLNLQGCGLSQETSAMVRSLPNLQVLKLGLDSIARKELNHLEWAHERLQSLRMKISDLNQRVDKLHFPLKQLTFDKNLALEESYFNRKKYLHGSIHKLRNLRTLIIDAPRWVRVSLPSEIWKLSRIRNITIDRMILPPIPGEVTLQKLENLHTLGMVEDFTFSNEVTRMIPNIRKLRLSYHGIEANGIWKLYYLNNLVNMLQLETLEIKFDVVEVQHIESFHGSFVFPQSLRKLFLEGCRLPWEALSLVGSMKFLQVLMLRKNALVGEVWAPVKGEFLDLRFLLMENLNLKHWEAEDTHFPCLEHLQITNCCELEEIPLDIGDIPTLQSITVCGSKLAGDSAKRILEEQQDLGNEWLQVIIQEQ